MSREDAPRSPLAALMCECCYPNCDCGCIEDCPASDCRAIRESA